MPTVLRLRETARLMEVLNEPATVFLLEDDFETAFGAFQVRKRLSDPPAYWLCGTNSAGAMLLTGLGDVFGRDVPLGVTDDDAAVDAAMVIIWERADAGLSALRAALQAALREAGYTVAEPKAEGTP